MLAQRKYRTIGACKEEKAVTAILKTRLSGLYSKLILTSLHG